MRSFLVHWLVTAAALAVSARIVPGIGFTSTEILLISALVLGLVISLVSFLLGRLLQPRR